MSSVLTLDDIYSNYEFDDDDFVRLFLMDYLNDYSLFEHLLLSLLLRELKVSNQIFKLLENISLQRIWESFLSGGHHKYEKHEFIITEVLDFQKKNYRKIRDAIAHGAASINDDKTQITFLKFPKIKKKSHTLPEFEYRFTVSVKDIHEMNLKIINLMEFLDS